LRGLNVLPPHGAWVTEVTLLLCESLHIDAPSGGLIQTTPLLSNRWRHKPTVAHHL